MIYDTAYFSAKIAARYPELEAGQVHEVCLLLMRRIYGRSCRDKDIRVFSGVRNFSLKIYKPEHSSQAHNQRVNQQARWQRHKKRPFTPPTSSTA